MSVRFSLEEPTPQALSQSPEFLKVNILDVSNLIVEPSDSVAYDRVLTLDTDGSVAFTVASPSNVEKLGNFPLDSNSTQTNVSFSKEGGNKIAALSPERNLLLYGTATGRLGVGITKIGKFNYKTNTFTSYDIDRISAIAWSSELGLFAAVGNEKALFSYDGDAWENASGIGSGEFANNVIWCREKEFFLATGSADFFSVSGGDMYISYDGKAWTRIPSTTTSLNNDVIFKHVEWSSERSMFVGVSTIYEHASQIDMFPDLGLFVRGIEYSPTLGKFICYVDNPVFKGIYQSVDAANWTLILNANTNDSQFFNNRLMWDENLLAFTFVSLNEYLYISYDGDNWQTLIYSTTNFEAFSVAYNPVQQVFAIVGSGKVYVGNNTTWSFSNISALLVDCIWVSGIGFVTCSGNSPVGIWTSVDGNTWTQRYFGGPVLASLAWSPELGLLVCAGDETTILSSSDGITWTVRVTGGNVAFQKVRWVPELSVFIAMGFSSTITYISKDGIVWKLYNSVSGNDVYSFVFANDQLYVLISLDSLRIHTSPTSNISDMSNAKNVYSYNGKVWFTGTGIKAGTFGAVWNKERGKFVSIDRTSSDGIGFQSVSNDFTSDNAPNYISELGLSLLPRDGYFANDGTYVPASDSLDAGDIVYADGKLVTVASREIYTQTLPTLTKFSGTSEGNILTLLGYNYLSIPYIENTSNIFTTQPIVMKKDKFVQLVWNGIKWLVLNK